MHTQETRYSFVHRLLHWSIALCLLFMLITIWLRLGWMNKYHVADIIQAETTPDKVQLSRDEVVSLAKKIRKPMWNWHIYVGYGLTGLYVLRLAHILISGRRFDLPWTRGLNASGRAQAITYFLFYLLFGLSLITGLLVEHGPDAWHRTLEDVHALGVYWLVTFVLLHFGGIVLAETGRRTGITSAMISGRWKG